MIRIKQQAQILAYRKTVDTAYTHALLVFVKSEADYGRSITGQAYVRVIDTSNEWWKIEFDASQSALQKGVHALYIYGQNSAVNTNTDNATYLLKDQVFVDNDPEDGEISAYDVATTLPPSTLNAVEQNAADIAALDTRVDALEAGGGLDCEDVANCAVIGTIETAIDEVEADLAALEVQAYKLVLSISETRDIGVAAGTMPSIASGNRAVRKLSDEVLNLFDGDYGLNDDYSFTLPAGVWHIEFEGAAFDTDSLVVGLYAYDPDAEVWNLLQQPASIRSGTAPANERGGARLIGPLYLSGDTDLRIEMAGVNSQPVNGQGAPLNFGDYNTYAQLHVWRVQSDAVVVTPNPPDEEPSYTDNYAVDLTGSNYVLLHTPGTTDNAVELTDANPFLISAWVLFDTTSFGYIWSSIDANNIPAGSISLSIVSDSQLRLVVRGTGPTLIANFTGLSNLGDGQYHHLVVTYSGSGVASGLRLYVDGVDKGAVSSSTAITGANDFMADGMYLGVIKSGAGVGFGSDTKIRQFSIAQNDESRTYGITEVLEIYNNGSPTDVVESSIGEDFELALYFENKTSTPEIAIDSSGNDNDCSTFGITTNSYVAT